MTSTAKEGRYRDVEMAEVATAVEEEETADSITRPGAVAVRGIAEDVDGDDDDGDKSMEDHHRSDELSTSNQYSTTGETLITAEVVPDERQMRQQLQMEAEAAARRILQSETVSAVAVDKAANTRQRRRRCCYILTAFAAAIVIAVVVTIAVTVILRRESPLSPDLQPTTPPSLETKPPSQETKTLFTTLNSTHSYFGHMFDLTAKNDLKVVSFKINMDLFDHEDNIEVWGKPGEYRGSEKDKARWALLGQGPISGRGRDQLTPLPSGLFKPVFVKAGTRHAFYIVARNEIIRFSEVKNGTVSLIDYGEPTEYGNSDLQINVGTGVQYQFVGHGPPNIFNGEIEYALV